MMSEFQKLVPRLSRKKVSEAYVCLTKYDGYIPTKANVQRSKKACSDDASTASPDYIPAGK